MGHVNPCRANALSFTLREPIGVAAQIIPWNYPLLMAAWKTSACAGRRLHLHPEAAEQTHSPLLEFAKWFEEAGLPPGVVNIINGFGEITGAALVAHPGVDKVAFTGSAAVGKIIVKSAADTLKRVTLDSAASPPTFSSLKLTGKPPSMARSSASSSIKAKSARPAAAFWSRKNLYQICRIDDRKSQAHQAGPAARSRNQDGSAGQ